MNTVTEFDKELDEALLRLLPPIMQLTARFVGDTEGERRDGNIAKREVAKEAIKQAVDKYVISEDDNHNGMNMSPKSVQELRSQQRQSLWGKK